MDSWSVKQYYNNTPPTKHERHSSVLLSTPMGVDDIVIDFDMEVQPLVTHNAA